MLFSPLLTLFSQPELFYLLKPKIFKSIEKIIQKGGNFIDSYGWDSILQLCMALSNFSIVNTFLIIKEILNDYNGYISLFNIFLLMKLLKLFISEENDKNMIFSSIELFWSCANIIEDYKQEKRKINDSQKSYFIKTVSIKDDFKLEKYCEDLYIILFSYLVEINNDSSIETKKSALNIFTEIFVSKMKSLNKENCLNIINDIFLKAFETNSDKYIAENKNLELEKILQTSLLCIVKITKEYINDNEKLNELIYEKYLNKIVEIIPSGSNLLITDILKSLIEIKISKNSNVPIISTKKDRYFKILSLIDIYFKGPNFILNKIFRVQTYRFFSSILSYINNIPKEEAYSDENLKNIFDIIDKFLLCSFELESGVLKSKPKKILDFENEVFVFLENIKLQENSIFNYLFDKMTLDFKNPHNEAIFQRSFESFHNLIKSKINDKKIFGINKGEKEIIYKYLGKIKDLINLRNNNEIFENLINSNLNKNFNIRDEINIDKYLENFIKIIDEIFQNFFKNIEDENISNKTSTNEIINDIYEIFLQTLELFEILFKQSIIGYKDIKESNHFILMNGIFQKMDIISSDFIMNKMLYYIQLIHLYEKNDLFEKLEKKLIHIIKIISDISYENNINDGESSFISLSQNFINELFKLCKYKTKNEILTELNALNIKIDEEKFVKNYIKTSKFLTNLLIKKIIAILKKFREDERKIGDMPLNRGRIYEIISVLNNVKDLEVYPNFNDFKKIESQIINKEEIAIFDSISNSRKIHLFYIQPILNDFIFSKENSIKNIVKEIFNEITNTINLPKLINIDNPQSPIPN